jgi:hypothetical protein
MGPSWCPANTIRGRVPRTDSVRQAPGLRDLPRRRGPLASGARATAPCRCGRRRTSGSGPPAAAVLDSRSNSGDGVASSDSDAQRPVDVRLELGDRPPCPDPSAQQPGRDGDEALDVRGLNPLVMRPAQLDGVGDGRKRVPHDRPPALDAEPIGRPELGLVPEPGLDVLERSRGPVAWMDRDGWTERHGAVYPAPLGARAGPSEVELGRRRKDPRELRLLEAPAGGDAELAHRPRRIRSASSTSWVLQALPNVPPRVIRARS